MVEEVLSKGSTMLEAVLPLQDRKLTQPRLDRNASEGRDPGDGALGVFGLSGGINVGGGE